MSIVVTLISHSAFAFEALALMMRQTEPGDRETGRQGDRETGNDGVGAGFPIRRD